MNSKIKIFLAILIFGILFLSISQFVTASFFGDIYKKAVENAQKNVDDLASYKAKLISCGLTSPQIDKVMKEYPTEKELRDAVRLAVSDEKKFILGDIEVEKLKSKFYFPGVITSFFESLSLGAKSTSPNSWISRTLSWISNKIDWLFGFTVTKGVLFVGLIAGAIGFIIGFFKEWLSKKIYRGTIPDMLREIEGGIVTGLFWGSLLMFLVFLFAGGFFWEMISDFFIGLFTAGILLLTLLLENFGDFFRSEESSKEKKLNWLTALVWLDKASVTTSSKLLRIFKYLSKPLMFGFIYSIVTHIPLISIILKHLTLYWFAPYLIKPIILAVIIGYLPEIGFRILRFKKEKEKQQKLNKAKVAAQVIKDLGEYNSMLK